MIRTIAITAFATLTITSAHAAPACMARADLTFAAAVHRDFAIIDTGHRGCVTVEQIEAYKAAAKADRKARKDRIAAALHG